MSDEVRIPAKTAEVLELLKQRADDMRTITYGEIAEQCGLAASGVGYPLGYIRDEVCRANGRPWLSVIAVSKDRMRPGGNFLPEGVTLPDDETKIWWRGMVLQVYSYDWSNVTLNDEPNQPR